MKIAALFLLTFLSTATNAGIKSIYGVDERLDIYESSDTLMVELSRSTAAQLIDGKLKQTGDTYTLRATTLKDSANICASERFSNQPSAADCSGFLVAPDILITAGHCAYVGCGNHSWVFDYANATAENDHFTFSKNQIYRCDEILFQEKNDETKNDYAIIKLDRAVVGRSPLKFRTTGVVSDDAVLTVIGHPSGLPAKIASGAQIRNNSHSLFFTTDADTFKGNSGSAVFDTKTGLVEGILVRGDNDYIKSQTDSCRVAAHYEGKNGAGEDVTRIMNLEFFLKTLK